MTARSGVPHADMVARGTCPDFGLWPERQLIDEVPPRRDQGRRARIRPGLHWEEGDRSLDRLDRCAKTRATRIETDEFGNAHETPPEDEEDCAARAPTSRRRISVGSR